MFGPNLKTNTGFTQLVFDLTQIRKFISLLIIKYCINKSNFAWMWCDVEVTLLSWDCGRVNKPLELKM